MTHFAYYDGFDGNHRYCGIIGKFSYFLKDCVFHFPIFPLSIAMRVSPHLQTSYQKLSNAINFILLRHDWKNQLFTAMADAKFIISDGVRVGCLSLLAGYYYDCGLISVGSTRDHL